MDIREAARYFRKLFSLWRKVSEAYAGDDFEAALRLSRQMDRLQLSNWRRAANKADAH